MIAGSHGAGRADGCAFLPTAQRRIRSSEELYFWERMVTKGNEARLIAAVVAGATLDQTAEAAGLSRTTVQRRLRDPEFRARVERERDTAIGVTVRELAESRSSAVARILSLLDSENESIVLRAATTLLKISVDYEDKYETDQKLSALEELTGELVSFVESAERERAQ